jgi:murein DD-endopeptidase MepM/ murein hydrolase activator NlpD
MFSENQQPSNRKSPKGAGFYIALTVCLAAIGVSVWSTADSIRSLRAPINLPDHNPSSAAQAGNPVSGVPYSSEPERQEPVTSVQPPANSSSGTASEQSGKVSSDIAETNHSPKPPSSQKPKPEPPSSQKPLTNTTFIMPVSGRIIKPFSKSVYSQTFEDWRAHMGVDISARPGSNVMSVGNGTVTDIYQDDLLGTVIAIRYDALEVHYCGLGNNPSVKTGEEVMCGQVLGVLKEVPGECVDESHLHLQVKKDGQWVEPLAALGKEDQLPSEPA